MHGEDHADDVIGGADLVGDLDHLSCEHSGCTITTPSGCSERNASTCPVRKRWCTEQWPFQSRKVASLTSASRQPAEAPTRIDDLHVRCSVAELETGVAAEVLVGEEEDLVPAAPEAPEIPPTAPRHGRDRL